MTNTVKIYALKDNKIGFVEVFIKNNDAVCIRDFQTACQNQNSPLAKHPDDFAMYKVGEMDIETGKLKEETRKLIDARECVSCSQN